MTLIFKTDFKEYPAESKFRLTHSHRDYVVIETLPSQEHRFQDNAVLGEPAQPELKQKNKSKITQLRDRPT